MTWFAFKGYANGQAVDIAGSQEKQAVLLGFHGYATQAQAKKNPNTVAGLFPDPVLGAAQKEFVNAIIADYHFAVKAGEQPGGPHATLTPGNIIAGTAQAAVNSIPGLQQIGDFFSGLTSLNLWIRVAKVLVGGTLLIVGLAKMAGVEKGIVGTAVKVAPLL